MTAWVEKASEWNWISKTNEFPLCQTVHCHEVRPSEDWVVYHDPRPV